MAKTQLDFSGARGIIDPLQGLMSNLQQTNSNLGQMIVQDEARKQQELNRARESRQDALTTPGSPEWIRAQQAQQEMKISGLGAEQEWKATNDPVYQNALAAAKRETPGSPEWLAAQDALQKLKLSGMTAEMDFKKKNDPLYQGQINALNLAENERRGKEALAKEMFSLPKEVVTSTTITPEQVDKTRTGLESAAVVNAGDVYNTEYTKLTKPETRLDVNANGEVITYLSNPAISPEEAHQKAMEKAQLVDVVSGKSPVIDESKLPKAGTTETKRKLTADELTQAKLDALGKSVLAGKVPATVALEVASKLTPIKTQKEKVDEAEYLLKEKEFQEKKASGYWKHNPAKGGGGTGDSVRKELDDMYKTYGKPDLVGSGDQARVQSQITDIQNAGSGYSDDQMKKAINASMGVYGNPGGVGVDETGFIESVQKNLLMLK